MLPKEMYTSSPGGGFYTRQVEADYIIQTRWPLPFPNMRRPPAPPRCVGPTQTGFKIDLYIFIYAHIKKEATGRRAHADNPRHPGLGLR